MRELEIEESQVYVAEGLLALGDLWFFVGLDRPALKDEPWTPIVPPPSRATRAPPTSSTRSGGATSWCTTRTTRSRRRWRLSSTRPRVIPTSLRSSRRCTARHADSPVIRSLVRAADSGKQVVALVELKARFDEQANIDFARTLETAGVHVVYGMVGLKTHAKTCLVVRREDDGIRRYAHIGTGNYNPKTARLYEDLGLLTCDPGPGCRPHRSVQPAHRLQPPARVPQALGGAGHHAPGARGSGPPRDRAR